ncbi:MAG: hypothetical protein WCJ84_04345 [Candidatus Peregrinibacteria bacterium]
MKTTTTIRIEADLLQELQGFAKAIGISFATLATAAFQKVLHDRKIELSMPSYRLKEEYEKELKNDPDTKETVFSAKKPGDSRAFLSSLISQ